MQLSALALVERFHNQDRQVDGDHQRLPGLHARRSALMMPRCSRASVIAKDFGKNHILEISIQNTEIYYAPNCDTQAYSSGSQVEPPSKAHACMFILSSLRRRRTDGGGSSARSPVDALYDQRSSSVSRANLQTTQSAIVYLQRSVVKRVQVRACAAPIIVTRKRVVRVRCRAALTRRSGARGARGAWR